MLHRQVDYKHDNLRLWQQQTSKSIAIEDIEYVVYKIGVESLNNLKDSLDNPAQCGNSFVKWIKKHNVTLVPTIILINSNGSQTRRIEGAIEKEQMEEYIRQLR